MPRTKYDPAIHHGGYPKRVDGRWTLTDGYGKVIGTGRQLGCTKIRPGQPGHWISGTRCSYQFMIDGKPYSCRGYGEGIAASCRIMKKKPAGLAGSRRRRKRRS